VAGEQGAAVLLRQQVLQKRPVREDREAVDAGLGAGRAGASEDEGCRREAGQGGTP
jgi:hypothetical protein